MNQAQLAVIRQQITVHLKNLQEAGITELPIRRGAPTQKGQTHGSAPTLTSIREEIGDCKRCRLCEGRTNIVFGTGNPKTELMFIGEAPGRDEDLKGEPFVGRAGQLLTKMIEAMGLSREKVYIANIVKCRPPDNRLPLPEESAECFPFLLQQIRAIQPRFIITLGNLATQTLLATKVGITQLHGKFHDFHGSQLMPTYHPAFLLRNPNMKKPCWEDLKLVMAQMGL